MSVIINGDTGITTPAETVQGALTTTGNTILGDASTDTLNVGNGGLVKDASGNVGIGTASPTKKVDVSGTYRAQIDPSNSSFFGATLTLAGDNGTNQSGGRIVGGYESSFGLLFQTSTTGQAGYNSDPSALTYTTKMKIDSSGNLLFNSGYGSAATAYGCRAWVNFNGQGTVSIRASGNVSSITDNGTGDYTVNFTTALVDGNYSWSGVAGKTVGKNTYVEPFPDTTPTITTSNFRIAVLNSSSGVVSDEPLILLSVFR